MSELPHPVNHYVSYLRAHQDEEYFLATADLMEALMRCYQETRACAYLTGFREFAGNTNTVILHTAIETVDALLSEESK